MAANQIIEVRENDGTITNIEVLGTARQVAANSKSVALSTEDKAQLDSMVTNLTTLATQGVLAPQAFALSRSIVPSTTIDSTKTRVTSAATVNNTLVSAAARLIRTIDLYNEAAYTVYFKFFDKATAPAAGTDTPFWTIPIPANSGFAKTYPWGIPVTLGLGFAITKNKVDSDTTAIAANDVTGMLSWR